MSSSSQDISRRPACARDRRIRADARQHHRRMTALPPSASRRTRGRTAALRCPQSDPADRRSRTAVRSQSGRVTGPARQVGAADEVRRGVRNAADRQRNQRAIDLLVVVDHRHQVAAVAAIPAFSAGSGRESARRRTAAAREPRHERRDDGGRPVGGPVVARRSRRTPSRRAVPPRAGSPAPGSRLRGCRSESQHRAHAITGPRELATHASLARRVTRRLVRRGQFESISAYNSCTARRWPPRVRRRARRRFARRLSDCRPGCARASNAARHLRRSARWLTPTPSVTYSSPMPARRISSGTSIRTSGRSSSRYSNPTEL